jgi:rod shape-determining protein MreD
MRRIGTYTLFSLLLVLLSTTLLRFLTIGDIAPDILLVWVVYIAIREGQMAGTVAGFLIGLAVDLLSGTDGMIGLAALSKTVGGFLAGYFYNENKTLQTLGGYQFLIAVGVVSLVHNVIYFLIFLQGTELSWWRIIVSHGVPGMVYTVAAGLLPMFVIARRHLT